MSQQDDLDTMAALAKETAALRRMPEEQKEYHRHIEQELKWVVIGGVATGLIALGVYVAWAVLVNPSMPHCLQYLIPPVCK